MGNSLVTHGTSRAQLPAARAYHLTHICSHHTGSESAKYIKLNMADAIPGTHTFFSSLLTKRKIKAFFLSFLTF